MRLRSYLDRPFDLIHSRDEIRVEQLRIEETLPDRQAALDGRLRFLDGSLLEFAETITVRGVVLVKSEYAYHFQTADSRLIFRYDNAPHHPELSGFPEHKHEGERITSSPAPDLGQVLRQIDGYLYHSS